MTSPKHNSGTERVAEVAGLKAFSGFELCVNVQGDEPLIDAAAIRGAVERVRQGDPIGTAAGTLDRWVDLYGRAFGLRPIHHEDIVTDHSAFDYAWIAAHCPLLVDTRNATAKVASARARIVKA